MMYSRRTRLAHQFTVLILFNPSSSSASSLFVQKKDEQIHHHKTTSHTLLRDHRPRQLFHPGCFFTDDHGSLLCPDLCGEGYDYEATCEIDVDTGERISVSCDVAGCGSATSCKTAKYEDLYLAKHRVDICNELCSVEDTKYNGSSSSSSSLLSPTPNTTASPLSLPTNATTTSPTVFYAATTTSPVAPGSIRASSLRPTPPASVPTSSRTTSTPTPIPQMPTRIPSSLTTTNNPPIVSTLTPTTRAPTRRTSPPTTPATPSPIPPLDTTTPVTPSPVSTLVPTRISSTATPSGSSMPTPPTTSSPFTSVQSTQTAPTMHPSSAPSQSSDSPTTEAASSIQPTTQPSPPPSPDPTTIRPSSPSPTTDEAAKSHPPTNDDETRISIAPSWHPTTNQPIAISGSAQNHSNVLLPCTFTDDHGSLRCPNFCGQGLDYIAECKTDVSTGDRRSTSCSVLGCRSAAQCKTDKYEDLYLTNSVIICSEWAHVLGACPSIL